MKDHLPKKWVNNLGTANFGYTSNKNKIETNYSKMLDQTNKLSKLSDSFRLVGKEDHTSILS